MGLLYQPQALVTSPRDPRELMEPPNPCSIEHKNLESLRWTGVACSHNSAIPSTPIQQPTGNGYLPGFTTLAASAAGQRFSSTHQVTSSHVAERPVGAAPVPGPHKAKVEAQLAYALSASSSKAAMEEESKMRAILEGLGKLAFDCGQVSQNRPPYAQDNPCPESQSPSDSQIISDGEPQNPKVDRLSKTRIIHARKEKERRVLHKEYLLQQYQRTNDVALERAGIAGDSSKSRTKDRVMKGFLNHEEMLKESSLGHRECCGLLIDGFERLKQEYDFLRERLRAIIEGMD